MCKTSLVTLVFLIACIIIVYSYDPVEYEDYEGQEMNRDPINVGEAWKRSRGFLHRRNSRRTRRLFRRNSRRTRRLRNRYPWKPTSVPPTTILAKKTTSPPRRGPEICQNHRKVSRIQDEPGPVVCLRRTSQELLKQLESIGGFLKKYVAVNQSEACGFEDLTFFSNGETKPPRTTTTPEVTTKTTTPMSGSNRHDDEETSTLNLLRRKRSIPTSPGTFIRGCQGRGTIVDDTDLHRLCTECSATTRLSDDRFPSYINEVICQDKDHHCAAKMGMCFQRTLELSFLRFEGKFEKDHQLSNIAGKDVYREVWEPYTQEIRSCCECEMFPSIYHMIASRDDDGDGDGSDSDEEEDKES